ncbi:MAG: nicotinamide-nucleotide amidohydrolase family protein [Lachnospiraceae bacterium]|nr:nicotinamide-nucleotide amidohydrolase family protein [Lachnospiraceae bacterium]
MRIELPIITIKEGKDLEQQVIALLAERHMTITTAESCTGGLIAGRLVNVSGASNVFGRGFVTYANEAKEEILGVKHSTLEQHGAVSKQTVKQMAKGAAKQAKADVAIAVTGVAGPDGGTPEKPVGLVYIGIYYAGKVYWQECHFKGNRARVRNLTVVNSLHFLKQLLLENTGFSC